MPKKRMFYAVFTNGTIIEMLNSSKGRFKRHLYDAGIMANEASWGGKLKWITNTCPY